MSASNTRTALKNHQKLSLSDQFTQNPLHQLSRARTRGNRHIVLKSDKNDPEPAPRNQTNNFGGLLAQRMALLKKKTQPKNCFSVFTRDSTCSPSSVDRKGLDSPQHSTNLPNLHINTIPSPSSQGSCLRSPPAGTQSVALARQLRDKSQFFSPASPAKKEFKKFMTVGNTQRSSKIGNKIGEVIVGNNGVRGKLLTGTQNLSLVYKKSGRDMLAASLDDFEGGCKTAATSYPIKGVNGDHRKGENGGYTASGKIDNICKLLETSMDSQSSEEEDLEIAAQLVDQESSSVLNLMPKKLKKPKMKFLSTSIKNLVGCQKPSKIMIFSTRRCPSIEEHSFYLQETSNECSIDESSSSEESSDSNFLEGLLNDMKADIARVVDYCLMNQLNYIEFDDLVQILLPEKKTPTAEEFKKLKEIEGVLHHMSCNYPIEASFEASVCSVSSGFEF